MNKSFFSPYWYRIAQLKPRLRGHTQIHRHIYRGEVWHVLQDHASGRMYRFTPATYQIIGSMNGNLTVQQLWENALIQAGDEAPSQAEMIQLLTQLHNADAIICNLPPDTSEIFQRGHRIRQFMRKKTFLSPLAIRIPLFDPDVFLTKTVKLVQPLFSYFGMVLWCVTLLTAIYLGVTHWHEFTNNIADRVLSTENLLLITLIFPVIKAIHELGHGYTAKHWGGEVHEVGVMLLVLMPVPYIDASSTSAFQSKWQRTIVASGGMIFELFFAALALIIWCNVESGLIHVIAYNVVLIAGVTTLLFNANPLLRYDGYYILSDLIEVPNLAQRSLQYLGYLFNRYVFGVKQAEQNRPRTSPGEPFWLVSYAITSFLYRILVYVGIILFISSKFFIVGIILAVWACLTMFIMPVMKKIHFILWSPMIKPKRVRAIGITTLLLGIACWLIFIMPMPYLTRAEGVIWVSEEAYVRAGSQGFVREIIQPSNTFVEKGQVLIQCYDEFLYLNHQILQAKLKELQAKYNAEYEQNHVESQLIKEQIDTIQARLHRAQENADALTITSPAEGIFILPKADDLQDRYVQKGQLLGYILTSNQPTVRVVVPQTVADLVRHQTLETEVKFVEKPQETYSAHIQQEIPGAIEFLPSTTLGSAGGGHIAIDPWDQQGVKAFDRLFQFDLQLLEPVQDFKIGGRVYVRFYHGSETWANQWYRDLRQLFLRHFNA